MEVNKKEIVELIDALGNDAPKNFNQGNPVNWLTNQDTVENPIPSPTTKKGGCKSGRCGTSAKTIISIGVIVISLMLAGHGLFTLIEKLCK